MPRPEGRSISVGPSNKKRLMSGQNILETNGWQDVWTDGQVNKWSTYPNRLSGGFPINVRPVYVKWLQSLSRL